MGLREWLRSKSRAERHRRKVERELWSPLPPVTRAEAAEVERIIKAVTGEFPLIETVMAPEPIGPSLPTVDERYALFAANPLTAELPGTPPKDNVFYANLLAEQALSEPVRKDLESVTGYWTADQMAQIIARGSPK